MWSSHATRRPVSYTGLHARQPRRAALLHTNGGGTDHGSLYGWWSQIAARGQHVGAHYQIGWSIAEQYVDSSKVIYHAFAASEWAVGIETQDDGHPERPWNDFQVETIIAICRELKVPGRLLTSAQPADGLGWHEQFVDWNRDGHRCPGNVRELQIRRDILPALLTHPTPTPSPVQEDDVQWMLEDQRRTPNPVWMVDGMERRWITTGAERDFWRAQGVQLIPVSAKDAPHIIDPLPIKAGTKVPS